MITKSNAFKNNLKDPSGFKSNGSFIYNIGCI